MTGGLGRGRSHAGDRTGADPGRAAAAVPTPRTMDDERVTTEAHTSPPLSFPGWLWEDG